MAEELNRGWKQSGHFSGIFDEYVVQGFKYVGPTGEVGWHTASWPTGDPIHNFWVCEGKFYRIGVRLAALRSTGPVIEIFEPSDDLNLAEQSAVLAAIETWERGSGRTEIPVEPQPAGISYVIESFQPNVLELHDSSTFDSVVNGDFSAVLTVNGVAHRVRAHARLVTGPTLLEKVIESYSLDLPPEVNIRADELQSAIRDYLFAFLSSDAAFRVLAECGAFS
jgi:hypothetical protein